MQPVFQDSGAAFNPRRTVMQLLAQASRERGLAGQSLQKHLVGLLEKVRLQPGADFLMRFPHELSGGQRQRLAIARAIAMDPMLIIADEPLSGADVSIRGQVLNLLLDLQAERGVAYLFITHDIAVARAFAHRVAVMFQGEIVEEGEAASVIDNPRHPYTQRLVAATHRLDVGTHKGPLIPQPAGSTPALKLSYQA
jgi:ABC-type glutathione transport system ATPase component